jgi:hypothetical protein
LDQAAGPSLSTRRYLVVAWVVALLLLVGVILVVRSSIVTVIALAPAWFTIWRLRAAVRTMADLPDTAIDERMLQVRNAAYRLAYVIVAGVATTLLLVGYLASDIPRLQWQPAPHHMEAALWFFIVLTIALPSAILAWTEREI